MMKNLSFTVKGHENTLSEHKTTLEFTRDKTLSKKGDCILGISADTSFSDLIGRAGKKLNERKLIVSISAGRYTDFLSGLFNPVFSSNHEMVIRKSNFTDARTFMTGSNKSAVEIDRKVVRHLKNPRNSARIDVSSVKLKNILFDFDNTLEEWQQHEDAGDLYLAKIASAKFKSEIPFSKFARQFRDSKAKFILVKSKPKYYGREFWLRDCLDVLGITYSKKDIDELVSQYWDFIIKRIKLFPGTKSVLSRLSKKYNLYLLSDSDGNRPVKERRLEKLDVKKYFKLISTSDDTGYNKPHRLCYERFLEFAGINPHETISVGDHPETDLITSKKLGMTTVWVKKGEYAAKKSYGYVDFEIDEITELPNIIKQIQS